MSTPATRPCPQTHDGVPCQKRVSLIGDEWMHGGGHWFMTDEHHACMGEQHYDPVAVLSLQPLTHLDIPCPRNTSAANL